MLYPYSYSHALDSTATENDSSEIHEAVNSDFLQEILALMEAKGDLNRPLSNGMTPLITAISMDFTDIALALIHAGVDVSGTDIKEQDPLILATVRDLVPVVKAILEKEAKSDGDVVRLAKAFRLAMKYTKNLETVQLFQNLEIFQDLDNFANFLFYNDKRGRGAAYYALTNSNQMENPPPLHDSEFINVASSNELSLVLIHFLYEKGLDLKIRDLEGYSLLHYAAKMDAPDTVNFLIDILGVEEIAVKNNAGLSPSDLAGPRSFPLFTKAEEVSKRLANHVKEVKKREKQDAEDAFIKKYPYAWTVAIVLGAASGIALTKVLLPLISSALEEIQKPKPSYRDEKDQKEKKPKQNIVETNHGPVNLHQDPALKAEQSALRLAAFLDRKKTMTLAAKAPPEVTKGKQKEEAVIYSEENLDASIQKPKTKTRRGNRASESSTSSTQNVRTSWWNLAYRWRPEYPMSNSVTPPSERAIGPEQQPVVQAPQRGYRLWRSVEFRNWYNGLNPDQQRSIESKFAAVREGDLHGSEVLKYQIRDLREFRWKSRVSARRVYFTIIDNNVIFLRGGVKDSHHAQKDDIENCIDDILEHEKNPDASPDPNTHAKPIVPYEEF